MMYPHMMYPITRREPKETAANLGRHHAQECYIAQFQKMTVSWEPKQAKMEAQKMEMEGRLTRRPRYAIPVTRLPSELLGEIFTIQVDRGGSPWTLLRVCRLWKVVATSTPHVWRYIHISWYPRRFDTGTSFQSCFTKAQFERALSRTGAAPLVISIDLSSYLRNKAEDSKRLFALFNILTKALNRCDTLELKGSHYFSAEFQELFATLQFPLLSSLRCLDVGAGWQSSVIAQKLLVACNHESTALRELSIHATTDRSLVHSLTDHQFLLERLTSFSAYDFEITADVLAAMPGLSYISQLFGRFALPRLSSVSGLLHEAHFIAVTIELGTQQFGNLRKLVLRHCDVLEQPGAIKLPILDTLIFENWTWLPILMLDCPLLSRLELDRWPGETAGAESEVNQIWSLEQRFAHIKALKIDMGIADTAIVTILEKSEALELLIITIESYHPSVFVGEKLFNNLLLKNAGCSGIVQNLHTLIFRVKYDVTKYGVFHQRLRTEIQRVVRSRQRCIPLWRATLQVLKWERHGEFIVIDKEEFVVCKEEQ